jgi:hypothetical protein
VTAHGLSHPASAISAGKALSPGSSISSGVDKDATLAQRSLDQSPSDTGPTPSELPIDDDHVDRRQDVPELTSQTNGFASCVPYLGFDHENVVIGPVVRLLSSARPEQNDSRIGRRGTSDPRSDLIDDFSRRHGP